MRVTAEMTRERLKRELRGAYVRGNLVQVEKKRLLNKAKRMKISQGELAQIAGVSQSAISQLMSSAREVVDVVPGFSAATLGELIERVQVGELSREQAVDELSRWEYEPAHDGDPDNPWLHEFDVSPGTWGELERAVLTGKLDADLVEEIRQAREAGW